MLNIFLQKLSKRYRPKAAAVISVQLAVLTVLLVSFWLNSRTSKETILLSKADKRQSSSQLPKALLPIPGWLMEEAFRLDLNSCQSELPLSWIDLLSLLGASCEGDFSHVQSKDINALADSIRSGTSVEKLAETLPDWPWYRNAYDAVLGSLTGYFRQEIDADGAPGAAPVPQETASSLGEAAGSLGETAGSLGEAAGSLGEAAGSLGEAPDKVWVTKYGLKAFHPIAKDFPFVKAEGFAGSGLCGRKESHKGVDLTGQEGTPLIAAESGVIDSMGWDPENGWQLTLKSQDGKRLYLYGHLRKNYPFQSGLSKGSFVTAGDVIGYLGKTGNSAKENTDGTAVPHLHFALMLLSEPDSGIWIDAGELLSFLEMNQSQVKKAENPMEWTRIYRQAELDEEPL